MLFGSNMPSDNSVLIERIVLNGGGAKGVGYPGVCQAIHDAGLFTNALSISGASVGSIFSAMIAIGTAPEVLRKKMLNHNLLDLVGNATLKGPNIIPGLTKNLDTVEDYLNQHLIETAINFLEKQTVLSKNINTLLQEIKTDKHQLSFNNLYTLHKAYPAQFKTLTVVAMVMGQYKLTVFDHQGETGDVSIARACIASSAMPMIFAPVKINDIFYQDGGIVDPLPSEYFSQNNTDESAEEKFKKTLLFVFDFDCSFFKDAVNQKRLTSLAKPALIIANILLLPLVNLLFFSINLTVFLMKCISYLLFIIPYHLIYSNYEDASIIFHDLSEVFFSLFSIPIVFDLATLANSLYTRISEQYFDSTILLNPGSINSNNFEISPMLTETMHALYYLDTIEHILKHELHDGSLITDENTFYQTILTHYHASSPPDHDLSSLDNLKSQYMEIKSIANKNHESPTAVALTKATKKLYRTVDLQTQSINHFFHEKLNPVDNAAGNDAQPSMSDSPDARALAS